MDNIYSFDLEDRIKTEGVEEVELNSVITEIMRENNEYSLDIKEQDNG